MCDISNTVTLHNFACYYPSLKNISNMGKLYMQPANSILSCVTLGYVVMQ